MRTHLRRLDGGPFGVLWVGGAWRSASPGVRGDCELSSQCMAEGLSIGSHARRLCIYAQVYKPQRPFPAIAALLTAISRTGRVTALSPGSQRACWLFHLRYAVFPKFELPLRLAALKQCLRPLSVC